MSNSTETWTRPAAWDAVDIIKRRVGSAAGVPEAIRALLESAEPRVHDAMVEALTQHGVLTREPAAGRSMRANEYHRLVTTWVQNDAEVSR